MRPRLIRPSFFAWVPVLIAAWAAYEHYGLPHVIWSYSYRGGESGFSSRYYTRCAFIGPYGEFSLPAEDGNCGWIAFFRRSASP
jgi:hypothetical protein